MLRVSGGAEIRTQAAQETMLITTILCYLHKGDSQMMVVGLPIILEIPCFSFFLMCNNVKAIIL